MTNVRELKDDDPLFSLDMFRTWRATVDQLLQRDWFVSVEDAGIENWLLYECFADQWSEEKFVQWFAEKYDLIDFRDPAEQLKAVLNLVSVILETDPASGSHRPAPGSSTPARRGSR